jgi:hypothetical protein
MTEPGPVPPPRTDHGRWSLVLLQGQSSSSVPRGPSYWMPHEGRTARQASGTARQRKPRSTSQRRQHDVEEPRRSLPWRDTEELVHPDGPPRPRRSCTNKRCPQVSLWDTTDSSDVTSWHASSQEGMHTLVLLFCLLPCSQILVEKLEGAIMPCVLAVVLLPWNEIADDRQGPEKHYSTCYILR